MQYINPNYHSWVALPLVGNIVVDNVIINNVFMGIDDFNDNYIYLLLNIDGTQSVIDYIYNITINNENYLNYQLIDNDLLLLKFKVKDKKVYKTLLNGDYANLDKDYHTFADSFIANCVRTTRNGYLFFYRMLFLILDNSAQLITDYWIPLFEDESEWLVKEIKNSGKYFSAPSPESNNLFTNYAKNILKKEYEISI